MDINEAGNRYEQHQPRQQAGKSIEWDYKGDCDSRQKQHLRCYLEHYTDERCRAEKVDKQREEQEQPGQSQ